MHKYLYQSLSYALSSEAAQALDKVALIHSSVPTWNVFCNAAGIPAHQNIEHSSVHLLLCQRSWKDFNR